MEYNALCMLPHITYSHERDEYWCPSRIWRSMVPYFPTGVYYWFVRLPLRYCVDAARARAYE